MLEDHVKRLEDWMLTNVLCKTNKRDNDKRSWKCHRKIKIKANKSGWIEETFEYKETNFMYSMQQWCNKLIK